MQDNLHRFRASTFTVVGLFTFMTLTGGSAPAGDWPEFRGPTRDGLSSAAGVPIEWSETDAVAWKQPIAGSGWSSPVLADGRIYLTTGTGSAEEGNVSLRALCLDAADGHVLWDAEVFRPETDAAKTRHDKNSLASPTPIVRDGRLYVHFGHMGTAALDLDGNVLWRQAELNYSPVHGNGSSPELVGNLVVFSCDGAADPFLAALDSTTGQLVWKQPRESPVERKFSFSTPLAIEVDRQTQIVSPASGYVGAFDPADGHEIWRVNYGEGFSVIPRPVYANGLVYVASGYGKTTLLAINPRRAAGDVTDSHVVWRHDRGVPNTSSLLVVGNEIYFVADNGVASCLDATSGEAHWSERLGGGFSASPVYADGRIYFVNEAGTTYVVAAGTDYQLLATNELGERSLASPAVDDGALFVRTEGNLWRIGK